MSCLRRPRTTQERRMNQEGWGRAKRSPHRLPDAWDDIVRGDYRKRSWKYYRSHQYKVKKISAFQ